ncbi:hypothetical protein [Propioniciclava sinopodophylli]|uniref:hypothetical protein n=1 Tax=Propioniciclava sinopodophylli TaxID=1837344 RepID=UPI003CD0D8FF
MLLRRLGLALKSHWAPRGTDGDTHTHDEWERPLGRIAPVGTSATLGDKGDPAAMLAFDETIFGETLGPDAVVTESRLSLEEWAYVEPPDGITAVAPTTTVATEITDAVERLGPSPDPQALAATVLRGLWLAEDQAALAAIPLVRLAKAHGAVRDLVRLTASATHIDDLERALFPGESPAPASTDVRRRFVIDLVARSARTRWSCAVHACSPRGMRRSWPSANGCGTDR